MFLDFIQALSNFCFDLGFVLPCWDLIAEAGGVCR
jgi:hypothetical protein